MREFFYEESALTQNEKSAKLKFYTFKSISIISYILMVLWVFIVIYGYQFSENIFVDLIIVLIPFIIFLLSGIFLGKFKNKFYVDYDYTLVSDSLRFSKVIKNIKRKFIIKFNVNDIEKIGEYGCGLYNKYESMPGINKLILTSNSIPADGKDFYYLVANVEGDKKLLVLESSQTLIVNIMKFANKTILDEEYVKKLSSKK